MRSRLVITLLAIAACKSTPDAKPQQEPVPAAKPALDPWGGPAGSADGGTAATPAIPAGSAADGTATTPAIPKWASDPPDVLRDKINGVNAHVVVLKSSAFPEYRDAMKVVERTPGVVAASTFIFTELEIAKAGTPPRSIALKGVDPTRAGRVLTVGRHMTAGTLDALAKGKPPPIVLGDDLARALDVRLGDEVTVTLPPAGDPEPLFKPTVFRVAGTFHMDFDEYDERLALAPLSAVQAMLGRGDQVMGIELTVRDLDKSGELAKAVEDALGGPPYQALDWYELNKNLFTALYGARRP